MNPDLALQLFLAAAALVWSGLIVGAAIVAANKDTKS